MMREAAWAWLSLLALGCSAGGQRDPVRASGGASGAGVGGAVGVGGASGSAGAGGSMSGGSGAGGSAAAGSGGSGSSAGNAGSAGSTSSGGATSALFFDDFEAPSLDTSKWTERINGGGSYTLDGAHVHGESQALHVTQSGFSTLLAAEGAPIFPAPGNTFYGRVWLYVPGPLPSNHVIWIEGGDVMNDQHEVRIGMNLGYFQVNLFEMGSEVDIRAPSAALMADTWHCVEFKMGNDDLEIWLDSARIDELSTTNWVASDSANGNTTPKSNWSPTYAALRIGWELQTGQIFFDDVALDHARIGCN
ncbi:MAG TPA: hypothetical protein VGP93_21180 [Polyangiaceae bacterium]|nr:hypothetical protein [Polyangiaceae bacterium]